MVYRKSAYISLLLSATLAMTCFSCKNKSRFTIDTDKERVQTPISRFDKTLLAIDTADIQTGIQHLAAAYPDFYHLFIAEILDVDPIDTLYIAEQLSGFLTDSTFIPINKKVLETFQDVTDIEKQLSDGFTYIHHYFPAIKLPEVYFFVSGFNSSIIGDEAMMGIGVDRYLGNDYKPYQELTYQYMIYNMRRESVVTDIVSAILFKSFFLDPAYDRLIDNIMHRGKIMYVISTFLPDEEPEDIMGYTKEQWDWCKHHEKSIWAAMIDKKDIFSTDFQLIRKYVNDAPFTEPISQESPGRLGTWVGWQIIDSYMSKNKEITLLELMNNSDYQKILEKSGYRP